MPSNNQPQSRLWLPTVALAAAALLAGCGRPAETTATNNDSTRSSDVVVTDSGKSAGQVVDQVGQDVRAAGQAVADTTKDIAITTEINTLLARDDKLSAMKINVDTQAGQVMLNGTAPSDEDRTRAADLARSVGGVINVDNKLQVQARN